MSKIPSNNPSSSPEFSALSNRINTSVSLHQRKIRALTTAAFTLGIVTIIASIVLVIFYVRFYGPKQSYLLDRVMAASHAKQIAAIHDGKAASPSEPDYGAAQVTLTYALSYGVMFLAIAIGCLGVGTITIALLSVVQRRATLGHISNSLAQISEQLKGLNSRTSS